MSSASKRTPLLICCALVLLILAAYSHVKDCGFVNYDDNTHVHENPIVQGGLTWPNVRAAFASPHACLWIPATWVSYMAEVSIFSLRPDEMHIANVLLHAANAALLFLFLLRTTGRLWPSAAVAGIFALHPINVESVAWITERKNVLCLFFGLLSLHAYASYVKSSSKGAYLGSLVLFALALMAKPLLIPLPAGILLLDAWPFRRIDRTNWMRRAVEKIPFLLVAIGSAAMTMASSLAAGKSVDTETLPVAARVSNALISYAAYLRQFVWPSGLCVLYPHTRAVEFLAAGISLVVLIAITIAAWRTRRRYPYVLVGWLWFLGMLVPMIGLIQVGTQARADRFTYVAQLGIFIPVVWLIADLWGNRPRRHLTYSGIVVIAGLLMATILQVEHWTNGATLFEHAIAVTDKNARAYHSAGIARSQLGDYGTAIAHYKRSLIIDTDNSEVWNNLSSAYIHLKLTREAIYSAGQALALKPDYPEAQFNLASAYEQANKIPEAIAEFRKLIEAHPDFANAHFRLGQIFAQQGDRPAAIEALRTASQLRPGDKRIANALRNISK